MAALRLLSATLIGAALLATPALAREKHINSRHLTENAYANTNIGAGRNDWRSCHGNLASGLRGDACGHGDRDVWGHWGSYYGPMVPVR